SFRRAPRMAPSPISRAGCATTSRPGRPERQMRRIRPSPTDCAFRRSWTRPTARPRSAEPLPSRSGHVRPAVPHDAAAIARLHIRSWQVGYRGQLPETLLDALDADLEPRTARWQHFITEAKARGQVQLVAEVDGRVVGFVTFGPSEDEPRDPGIGEVYAIYVDPDEWDR